MFKLRHWACLTVFLCALPCLALVERFGSDAMPVAANLPRGLGDLINDETRFAGSVGPIADYNAYHRGDTAEFNKFLESFSKVPDTTLIVYITRREYAIPMKNYDGTERSVTADWILHVAEFFNGRPDEGKFGSKKCYAEIAINPSGAIKLKEILLPSNLVAEADEEFKVLAEKLNRDGATRKATPKAER